MEIIYFTLGMLSILMVIGILALHRIWKNTSLLKEDIQYVWTGIDCLNNDLGNEIDLIRKMIYEHRKDTEDQVNTLHNNLNAEVNEIHQAINLRLNTIEEGLSLNKIKRKK
jgi:hypothetical protein